MSDLKPCPFCGSKAYDCLDDSYGNGIIGCGNCEPEPLVMYHSGDEVDHKKAIDAWNKRVKQN